MEDKTTHSKSAEVVEKMVFMKGKPSNIPQAIESNKKVGDFEIISWGKDNLYPQWLNYLYENNSIHGGIIRSKVHYTVSGGLSYDGDENDKIDVANWKMFLKNGNSDFNLNEIVEQAALDLYLSSKFILRGIWDINFEKCEKLELIDYETGRKLVNSDNLIYSEDWSDKNANVKIYKPLDLTLKGSKPTAGETREREFFIEYEVRPKQSKIKDKRKIKKGVYPSPPYSGGIRSICTGIDVDEYQNSEINNNFALGTIVNLNNGKPKNPQDKKDIEGGIKGAATGVNNTGGVWIAYNNGKDRAATVERLNGNDLADRYNSVDTGSHKKTLYAHSITAPILFGFKEEGSLGNATELQIAYSIMKANQFRVAQNALLSAINLIGRSCNGLKGNIIFNEVELELPKEESETPSVIIDQRKFSTDEKSKEDKEKSLLHQLGQVGSERSSFRLLHRSEIRTAEFDETTVVDDFRKSVFAELSSNQSQVLALIAEGNDFTNIKTAMELKASQLARIYQTLISEGLLEKDGKLTESGFRQVAADDSSKMRIVYSYELRVDAPPLKPGGKSRDFCETLVGLNRFYSREEINVISAIEGYDVFQFKGGWYHNPETDQNKPFCRHTWVQNVVFV